MTSTVVVVVGTTADYIDLIRHRYPNRAVFITDPEERRKASEETPEKREEILCDLSAQSTVIDAVKKHTSDYDIEISGIACFDCESLGLAARLAERMGFAFPSPSSVSVSRNKFLSKRLWQSADLCCPDTIIARHAADVNAFLRQQKRPIILKPLTGSGSEWVFKAGDPAECLNAYQSIMEGVSRTVRNRLYMSEPVNSRDFAAPHDVVMETFIDGPEYSCDFYVDGDHIEIIRIARKIMAPEGPVGTTLAYILPEALPAQMTEQEFRKELCHAANTLGIKRSLCMVDFIIHNGRICLLELTPRPGGDCLPWLLRLSSGLDMLGLALDVAEGGRFSVPSPQKHRRLVGLRLFASQAGTIKKIDTRRLDRNPAVIEILIKRQPGHQVRLPPEDYDSRNFGHLIFVPDDKMSIEEQCGRLSSDLIVEMVP